MIRLYNILVIFFILSGCACWFATFLDNEIKGVICVIMLFLWNKISSNTLNRIPYHCFVESFFWELYNSFLQGLILYLVLFQLL